MLKYVGHLWCTLTLKKSDQEEVWKKTREITIVRGGLSATAWCHILQSNNDRLRGLTSNDRPSEQFTNRPVEGSEGSRLGNFKNYHRILRIYSSTWPSTSEAPRAKCLKLHLLGMDQVPKYNLGKGMTNKSTYSIHLSEKHLATLEAIKMVPSCVENGQPPFPDPKQVENDPVYNITSTGFVPSTGLSTIWDTPLR